METTRVHISKHFGVCESKLRHWESLDVLPRFGSVPLRQYTSKLELVLSARDEMSLQQIRKVLGADAGGEVTLSVPITKRDEDERIVEGYASTPDLDSQGDRISIDALRDALPGYMKFGNIREMHQPSAVGKTLSAGVDSRGLRIRARIVDDSAWKKVKAGVYSAFSIGGRVLERAGETIRALALNEISLVDRPANPAALITLWKRGDATAAGVFHASIRADIARLEEAIAKLNREQEAERAGGDKVSFDSEGAQAVLNAAAADFEKREGGNDMRITISSEEEADVARAVRWCEKAGARLREDMTATERARVYDAFEKFDPEGSAARSRVSARSAAARGRDLIDDPSYGFDEAERVLLKRVDPGRVSSEALDLIEKFARGEDLLKSIRADRADADAIAKAAPPPVYQPEPSERLAKLAGGGLGAVIAWRELEVRRDGRPIRGIERFQMLAAFRTGDAPGNVVVSFALRPVSAGAVDWSDFDHALRARGLAGVSGRFATGK